MTGTEPHTYGGFGAFLEVSVHDDLGSHRPTSVAVEVRFGGNTTAAVLLRADEARQVAAELIACAAAVEKAHAV